jgi:hypothetical protein
MAHPETAETCSWFLQHFENTVVLRRTFIHLIYTNKQPFYVAGVCMIPTNISFQTEQMYKL